MMNDTILQTEQKQRDCNQRANALFQKLSISGEKAVSMIHYLNNSKIKILIAKIKLLLKKLRGETV